MNIKLSPSILSADFANLERDMKTAVDAGAEYGRPFCAQHHHRRAGGEGAA